MTMNSLKIFILIFFQCFFVYSFSQSNSIQNSQFTVVIDAGHGGKDPGNTGNGFIEKDIALKISTNLGTLLEKRGVNVIYTRKKDVFVGLFERANIANQSDAQLFISIHCDAFRTSQPYGAGTFVLGLHANERNFEIAKKENSVIFYEDDYENTYDGFDPNNPESVIGLTLMQEEYLDQSIIAASYIQNSFVNSLKRKNRDVKQAGFAVLRYTYMPSVLVETGFLTNKNEGLYLNSSKGQTEIANAISLAVLKYRNDFFKNLSTSAISNESSNNSLFYRVQIAASKKLLDLKPYNFNGLKSVDVVKEGSVYKYLYGKHKSIEDANESLVKAKNFGFETSFIITYQNNKIITTN
ncbi:MAG: N-acetylmuramoyl-L-alanine amidase [Candidatus Marinimicrobia bacterium]|nr:N-acetylmuramoyl-L-alanine amidase [Candidatus Neomarinimicrobiota bacterium]MBT7739646.1 N-acetylmuramoyl-L-alanine amidase [Cryomorphaceae bacterium]